MIVLCYANHTHSKLSQRQLLVFLWLSQISLGFVVCANSSFLQTTHTSVAHV